MSCLTVKLDLLTTFMSCFWLPARRRGKYKVELVEAASTQMWVHAAAQFVLFSELVVRLLTGSNLSTELKTVKDVIHS